MRRKRCLYFLIFALTGSFCMFTVQLVGHLLSEESGPWYGSTPQLLGMLAGLLIPAAFIAWIAPGGERDPPKREEQHEDRSS